MNGKHLSGPDRIVRFYYRAITQIGRLFKGLMWKIVELRHGGKRIHPKHQALPWQHHHWYAESIQPDWHVADLGCDRGGHVWKLLDAGATVVGVEKSTDALAQAFHNEGVEYLEHDLEQPLPFADETFDAVLALDVIEHLHCRDEFLAEILRISKPGATLFLSAPNRATKWKQTARRLGIFEVSDPDHKIEYEKGELIDSLEKAGFTIDDIAPVVLDTPFDAWIDSLGAISLRLYRWAWMGKRNRALRNPDQSTGFRIVAKKPSPNEGGKN